ncbi:MAG: glycoside hydrolase family 4 [Halobacteriales archaeon]
MSTPAQEARSTPEIDGDDMTITYIGGGARAWAPKFVQDMALSGLDGEVRLYDINYEGAKRNARFGNWVQEREAATADWTYEAYEDRAAALEGADAVIASTQFDPAETFVHDLDIPEEYGIYGAVSATIGPGGIFRAMRTIPVYKEFAAAIREHCPDAWVFNFTNPVHFVTRALYDEYPDINAVGLCHEVLGTRSHLASLAEEHLGMDASREDVEVNVKGINHFTWIDEARCKGVDLWPLLEDLVDSEQANRSFTPEDLEGVTPFVDNQQVTWELFRRFGVFPAAGDRHLVEYATWFLNGGKEGLNRWGVKRTGSDWRAKHWNPSESEQTTDVEAWMEGEEPFELESSGEIFADMLGALAGGEPFVANVNMPNTGQVAGIEEGAAVETNALVRSDEIRPLSAGGFPRPVETQIAVHVDTIETIIEAARTGDVDLAFQGFLNDPQVRTLQTEDARELFAELAAAEEGYLSDWDLEGSETLAESSAF